jgi:hypothetical protein
MPIPSHIFFLSYEVNIMTEFSCSLSGLIFGVNMCSYFSFERHRYAPSGNDLQNVDFFEMETYNQ